MVIWFEIPVNDFEASVEFYSNVLRCKLKKVTFEGIQHAIFDSLQGVKGSIVKRQTPISVPPDGPVLFFKVPVMSDNIEIIKSLGGKIIKEKTLMKASSESGSTVISKTLLDNEIGYYALFEDPEGNRMGLYSNS